MTRNFKILLCMKNEIIQNRCKEYFEVRNCSVYICRKTFNELYNAIKETKPDAVICDRKLSDCVSYEVFEKLGQEGTAVKMFVTPSEYYITDGYFSRMPYFTKPINTKCLGCMVIHKLQLEDNILF